MQDLLIPTVESIAMEYGERCSDQELQNRLLGKAVDYMVLAGQERHPNPNPKTLLTLG